MRSRHGSLTVFGLLAALALPAANAAPQEGTIKVGPLNSLSGIMAIS
jgi:hypothetical protein